MNEARKPSSQRRHLRELVLAAILLALLIVISV